MPAGIGASRTRLPADTRMPHGRAVVPFADRCTHPAADVCGSWCWRCWQPGGACARGRSDHRHRRAEGEHVRRPPLAASGTRQVRYIAPWDALRDPVSSSCSTTGWRPRGRAGAARAAGLRALAAVAAARARAAHAGPFEREFVRFRARYPDVHEWIVWNEANHPLSLTADRPRRAARYFDAVARNCRSAASSPPTCSTSTG